DGVTGDELWASDGTAANTHVVADIGGPEGGSMGSDAVFVPSGSRVFFEAVTNETGAELWAVPVAALLDSDLHGLDYAAETAHATALFRADTDGDGYADGVEVTAGTDPLDPASVPAAPIPMTGPWGLGALAALLLASGRVALRYGRNDER